jgi:hypothetical protein
MRMNADGNTVGDPRSWEFICGLIDFHPTETRESRLPLHRRHIPIVDPGMLIYRGSNSLMRETDKLTQIAGRRERAHIRMVGMKSKVYAGFLAM